MPAMLRKLTVLLTVALAACSADLDGTTGGLQVRARFPDHVVLTHPQTAYRAQAFDATLTIETVRVSALQDGAVRAQREFAADAREGSIFSLPAGEYEVRVEGIAGGTVVLRDKKTGVTIDAGAVKDAGEFLLAPVSPRAPVLTLAPPAVTSVATLELAGTKEMFTGIRAGGETAAEPDDEKTFRFTVTLSPGENTIALTAFTTAGAESEALLFAVMLQTAPPAPPKPSLSLAGSPGVVSTATVTLALAAANDPDEMQLSESASFSGAAWLPFAAAPVYTLSPGDGVKTIHARVRNAGGESPAASLTVLVDRTPPVVNAFGIAGGLTAVDTVNVTLALDATDAGALEVQVSEDPAFTAAAWQAYAASLPFTLSGGDGAKTVHARVRDAAGHLTAAPAASVTVDTAIPLAYVTVPAVNTIYPAPLTQATGTAADAGGTGVTGVHVALMRSADGFYWDGFQFSPVIAWNTDTSGATAWSWSLPPLADGAYELTVRAADGVGNVTWYPTYTQTVTFTIDTTPPVLSSVSLANGAADGYLNAIERTLGGLPVVTWSGAGYSSVAYGVASAAAQCSSAGAYTSGTAPDATAAEFASDATYFLCVELQDAAGWRVTGASAAVTVDTAAPVVAPLFDVTAGAPAYVTAAVSGGATFAWSQVAGPGTAAFSAPAAMDSNVSADTDGSYVLRLTAADYAGNTSAASFTLVWDTAGPSAPGTPVLAATPVSGATWISWTAATDTLSGVLDYIVSESWDGGATWTPLGNTTATSYDIARINGFYRYKVLARDNAYNWGTESGYSAELTVDTSPPTGNSVVVQGSPAAVSTAALTLVLTSTGAAMMQVGEDPTFASTSWEPFTASRAYSLSGGAGTYVIHARFRDAIGNTSAVVSTTVDYDFTPPTGTVAIAGAPAAVSSTAVTLNLTATGAALMQVSEDPSFAVAAWEPFTPSAAFLLSEVDGLKTIYARFRDDAGNTSAPVTAVTTLDGAAPTVSSFAIQGYPTAVSTTALTLQVFVSDTTALEMELRNDAAFTGAFVPYTNSPAFELAPGEGEKTIFARFRDAAGNEVTATTSVTLDQTAPVSTLDHPADLQVYNALTSAYGTSIGADTAGVEVALLHDAMGLYWDGASFSALQTVWLSTSYAAGSWSYALPPLADGSYTLSERASDWAGNAETARSATFTYDTLAPAAPGAPAPAANPVSGAVSLSWTPATDGNGIDYYEIEVSIDKVVWAPIATTTATTFAYAETDGVYAYRIRAFDPAGNDAYSQPGPDVHVDSVAPSVSERHPFMLEVTGTLTYTRIDGTQANEYLGTSVAAGDFNADGFTDYAVGEPYFSAPGYTNNGQVRVYLSASGGALGAPAIVTAGTFSDGAEFGAAVLAPGDLDGDGYGELVVGSPYATYVTAGDGAVLVYRGSPVGIESSAWFVRGIGQASSRYGNTLFKAGDVNGDGFDDFFVGAPNYDNQAVDEGYLELIAGNVTTPVAAATWEPADQAFARFGAAVAAGDLDNDGDIDLVTGAAYVDAGYTDQGKYWVFRNDDPATFSFGETMNNAPLSQAAANFGASLALADVNGDGYLDLLAGASGYDTAVTDEGAVIAIINNGAGLLMATYWTADPVDRVNAGLGSGMTPAGDLNGDGIGDVFVSAPFADFTGSLSGSVYAMSGADGSPIFRTDGYVANLQLGDALTAADRDGDGISDPFVGAQQSAMGGFSGGGSAFFLTTTGSVRATTPYGVAAFLLSSPATDVTGAEANLDNAGWSDLGAAWKTPKFTGLGNGAHTVAFRAYDGAGNRSAPASYAWTVSASAPSSPLVNVQGSPSEVSTATITLDLSAVGATQFQTSESPIFAGAAWFAYTTSAPFTLSPGSGLKTVYARFRNGAGNISASAATSVTYMPIKITSPLAAQGLSGNTIVVTGYGFGASQGGSTITLGGAVITPSTWSATQIQFSVPDNVGAGDKNLVVHAGGDSSNAAVISVKPVLGIPAPTSGTGGDSVVFAGSNLAVLDQLTIAGTPMLASGGMTAISATLPEDVTAGTRPVVVYAGGYRTPLSYEINYLLRPAIGTITGEIFEGASITLAGTNFGHTQGTSTLTVGGQSATLTGWSMRAVTATVPAGLVAGTGKTLSLTVGGQTAPKTITIAPHITSLTPASGAAGTLVTLTGTSFGPSQGVSTLTLGGATLTPSSWANASIAAAVPANLGPGAHAYEVAVGGAVSNQAAFTISPSITSLSNTTRPAGTALIITGGNFGAVQGAGTVTVGGQQASVTAWSMTSIEVTVPIALTPASHDVIVNAGGFASAPAALTVTNPSQVVFSPASGSFTAGTCQAMTVETQDSLGNPAPNAAPRAVLLGATGVAADFYGSPGCINALPGSTATIPGNAATVTVFVRATLAGSSSISGTSAGLTAASASFTWTPGPAMGLRFVAPATSISVGTCTTYTLEARDVYGNASNVLSTTTIALSASGPGQFYTDPGCATTLVTQVAMNTGTNTVSFFYKTGVAEVATLNGIATGLSKAMTGVSSTGAWPTLTAISPEGGYPGATVTLTGSSLGASQGTYDRVYFGGTEAQTVSWSDTTIVVTVPAAAPPGANDVYAVSAGKASNPVVFSHWRPFIDRRSPIEGSAGTTITLTGRNFDAAGQIFVDGVPRAPASWNTTAITFAAPGVTSSYVQEVTIVTGRGHVSNRVLFTQPAPDAWLPASRDVPAARTGHSAVWTGAEMVIWGGYNSAYLASGGRYNPATDTWLPTALVGAPAGRSGHTAVWTGKQMIVYGGKHTVTSLNTGGRYDPAADAWQGMAAATDARRQHAAVWTEQGMVVSGGIKNTAYLNTAERYDPNLDTWSFLPSLPAAVADHRMLYAQGHLYVLGGFDGSLYSNGVAMASTVGGAWSATTVFTTGRSNFNAFTDGLRIYIYGGLAGGGAARNDLQWAPINPDGTIGAWQSGAASVNSRYNAVGAWTGKEFLVFGGRNSSAVFSGGERWTAATGTWSNLPTVNQPTARTSHAGVWTGKEFITWGGDCSPAAGCLTDTGARYDPAANTWAATAAPVGQPAARESASAVWTGSEMIFWGGAYSNGTVSYLSTGSRYNPTTDSWTAMNPTGAPTGRHGHVAVWTGTAMVVLTGSDTVATNTGGIYNPATDTWTATSTAGGGGPTSAITARTRASGVWAPSISRVLVWGGTNGTAALDTGKRFDPVGNAWSAMAASTGLVPARESAATVWTGTEMVVFFGLDGPAYHLQGGRYNAATDTWAAISATGPTVRKDGIAVWTGTDMLVWGGSDNTLAAVADGGKLSGTTWTWTMLPPGPLAARRLHSGVWTGSKLIIWGGLDSGTTAFGDGASFDPASNTWQLLGSSVNTPAPRGVHAAGFTGTQMLLFGGGGVVHTNSMGRYQP